jgi:xanthosine utilization system XapX-like protein
MKLKDIEIPDGPVLAILGFGCIYFGACLLGLTMAIVKAIALYFFNYTITIGGIPL